MKKFSAEYIDILLLACAAVSVLVFPVVCVFYANNEQFALKNFYVSCISFLLFLLLSAFFSGIFFAVSKSKHYEKIHAFIIGTAISLIIQYHFSAQYFPDYTKSPQDFTDRIILFVCHLALQIFPLVLAYIFRKKLLKFSGKTSLIILLTQCTYLGVMLSAAASEQKDYDFEEYSFSEKDKFTFGNKENVILLVIDAMGRDIAFEMLEKYSELNDILKDFVCFDNIASPVPWTIYAVPSMLSGIEFPHDQDGNPLTGQEDHSEYLKKVCRDKNSVFQGLKRHKFRTEGYPFVLQTISYAPDVIDNSVPVTKKIQLQSIMKLLSETAKEMTIFPLRKFLFDENELDFVQPASENSEIDGQYDYIFYKLLSEKFTLGENERVFKYLHLHGAHEPVCVNENLEKDDIPQRVKQLRGSFKAVELLLNKLKDARVYDNATIIITGDHSEIYTPETITFVKKREKNGKKLSFNSTPHCVRDIAGTIIKEFESDIDLPSLQITEKQENPSYSSNRRYAVFSEWKRADREKTQAAEEILPVMLQLEENKLFFERFPDGRGIISSYLMVVQNDQNGTCWQAEVKPEKNDRYMISSSIDFPDGCYRIEVISLYVEGSSMNGASRRLNNGFLLIENGKKRMVNATSVKPEKSLAAGKFLEFELLRDYPMLILPENGIIKANQLTIPNGADLGIRLAPSEKNSFLEFNIQNKPFSPCFLNITTDAGFFCRIEIKDILGIKIAIPLGKTEKETVLRINFKFDIPEYINRRTAERIKVRFASVARQEPIQR